MSTFITNLTSHPYANVWVAISILIMSTVTSIYFFRIKDKHVKLAQRLFLSPMTIIYLFTSLLIIALGTTPHENPSNQSKIITVKDVVLSKTPTVTDDEGNSYKVDIQKELKKGDKLKIQLETDNVWRLAED